tara:strand:- start:585 stop:1208 length:624 start_codon:yes stop_codon:yes gene_type:complete
MSKISVIDYGMGNIHSVAKALYKVCGKEHKVVITDSIKEIESSDKIVFPGQGAAKSCMDNLQNKFNIDKLKELISRKPFLGICMGLQILMTFSEEDNTECLNMFDGRVQRIQFTNDKIKLPHMGWSRVSFTQDSALTNQIDDNTFFYFVHSYCVTTSYQENVMSYTEYGCKFISSLQKDNIIAVQFHPEKSSKNGLQLLDNFIKWRI